MSKAKYNLGLIGYPLSHSLSPTLHKACFDSCQLEGQYHLYPIKGEAALESICTQMREGLIHGLNVTIPHKINIIRYLDEITTSANMIGAANTLYMKDDHLMGHNTDFEGFYQDLISGFGYEFVSGGGNGLILGAGGAARAVAYVLLESGWNLTIAARRFTQAKQIRKDFSNKQYKINIIEFSRDELLKQSSDLIVNTTPVGMHPEVDYSPWPLGLKFPSGTKVYDLIYNPTETKFLRKAKFEGIDTRNGVGMLIKQAAYAFHIWTGHLAPQKAMTKALYQALLDSERNYK